MPWNDDNDNGSNKTPNNPWGNNQEPRGNSPWGQGNGPRRGGNGGNGSGGMPPDFDDLFKRAQANFRNVMPGNIGMGRATLLAVMVGILLWLSSGFYFIAPNENGVVLTFGKYSRTELQPGLKYALPWPVQQVFKVDVTNERRIEIGFNSGGITRGTMGTDTTNESLMLTGDENIIDIDFVVMWRIADAKQFLFEIRNPEDTIKMVAESAMREIIGHTKITSALTDERGQIQIDTKTLMQKVLDEYRSGVTINNIQLLKVDPPDQVIDAFNDVQRARAEAERMENEAQAYRNDILPRARGEAQKTLEDSMAYKQETIARASGDADRFNSVYEAYSKSKDVTTQRMYIETVEAILQNAKTFVFDGKSGQSVLPYMPIGDLQRRGVPSTAANSDGTPPQPAISR
jgi:modulator of FtsH protease HflK